MKLYFSDFFKVSPDQLKHYGAFNICLISDLPLFIDPFLLFNSKKPEYQALHAGIIEYLRFLREKSSNPKLDEGLIRAWYRFPEVNQNWLGFSEQGNKGTGLGRNFATALHKNLNLIFTDFGSESTTSGSHLEKLCLIESGVGRDNISDFTTNLIKEYLLEYTQALASEHVEVNLRDTFLVERVRFNYETETWEDRPFDLPSFQGDFVLLTPKDMLTRDQTWINKPDLVRDLDMVREAIPNDQLRAQINNYLNKVLPPNASPRERAQAALATIRKYPRLVDEFIKYKEQKGEQAVSISSARVKFSEHLYLDQFGKLVEMLSLHSAFYQIEGSTYKEALARVRFFKDVIENKGGQKLFYVDGEPVRKESDVHIMFRLTWFATPSDVSREVNDGRGPADFKVSRGSGDKSIVEFKLASNSQLEQNLRNQTEIYEKASDASRSIKVILFFSESEHNRVIDILARLQLNDKENVILVDARLDNKPSGSKAA
jgi:hypothetical protein